MHLSAVQSGSVMYTITYVVQYINLYQRRNFILARFARQKMLKNILLPTIRFYLRKVNVSVNYVKRNR